MVLGFSFVSVSAVQTFCRCGPPNILLFKQWTTPVSSKVATNIIDGVVHLKIQMRLMGRLNWILFSHCFVFYYALTQIAKS